MKVLLLHLPLARRSYLSRFALPEPLAQMYLAAALSPRHDVRIVDLRVRPQLDRELLGWRPDAAVVGVNPLNVAASDRALAALRERVPGLRVLLAADAEYGNAHVAERPHDFALPLADALVLPYFLAPMRRIVSDAIAAWEEHRPLAGVPGLLRQASPGTWTRTEPVSNVPGDIGIAARGLLGPARGRYRFGGIGRMAHLFYTYGCRFKCRFCPMSKHDGSIVARSLDEVLAELREMSEPNVYLQDFEPFLAPEAMERLADAVEREGIAKSWYMMTRSDTAVRQEPLIRRWKGLGLRWIYLGLDGPGPERLLEIGKANTVEDNREGLRRMLDLGLGVSVGFVVSPAATAADFAALRAHARGLGPALVSYTIETPLVGTKLHDEAAHYLTTRDWSLFDLEHAVLPTSMPLDAFYRQMARLQLGVGARALPTLLRHLPFRDVLRIGMTGLPAVNDLRRSARDHERPPEGSLRRGSHVPVPAHA